MKQCPKCNGYMKFHMQYVCGSPYIYYTCECGYDTSNEKTYTTSQITYDFKLFN